MIEGCLRSDADYAKDKTQSFCNAFGTSWDVIHIAKRNAALDDL